MQAAAGGGHELAVRILLLAGAQIKADARGLKGRTAMGAAAKGGHKDVMATLLDAGVEVTPAAVEGGHESAVRFLIEHGVEVTPYALRDAVKGGNDRLPLALIGIGVDGSLALSTAAEMGNAAIVEILIQWGTDVNGNEERETPLWYAASRGHERIVTTLIKAGATLNPPTLSVCPALEAALGGGYVTIAEHLIKAGARTTLQTTEELARIKNEIDGGIRSAPSIHRLSRTQSPTFDSSEDGQNGSRSGESGPPLSAEGETGNQIGGG